MPVKLDGYHLIDQVTAVRRGETLQFGPVVDTVKMIVNKLGRPPKLLDCGCGGGQLKAMLDAHRASCQYTGADLGLDNLIVGNQHYVESTFVAADINTLPFQDKSFDLVIALGILFILDDIPLALRELQRVADTVCINLNTTRQGSNSIKMLGEGNNWHTLHNFEHNHILFEEAGLSEPDQALHWEVSTDDSGGYYLYQGVLSRYQSLYIWHDTGITSV